MTPSGDQPRFGERAEADPLGDRVEGRQAPGYGEYAPEGWVSPVAPVPEPEASADGQSGVQDHAGTGSVRTEVRRPDTTSGFDAPPPTGSPVPAPPPAVVRRSAFNRFATLVLLAYGLYDVIRGALQTSSFVSTYVGEFTRLGYLSGTFESSAALYRVAVVSAVASVAVFLLVAIWALRRLRRGRLAWPILLVAGFVANIVTGLFVVVIVMNDASFVGMAGSPL